MNKYGLIGKKLSHSFSKKYFTEKFERESIQNSVYENFELDTILDFKKLLAQNPDLKGLNVTVPYKEEIIPLLDEISDEAKAIGAVNTIRLVSSDPNGRLGRNKQYSIGFNTDIIGFINALKPMLRSHHTQALVLGNGGAAKAVKYVLKKLGINFHVVGRKKEAGIDFTYEELNENHIKFHPLIIQTTPVGMFPNINEKLSLPYSAITPEHFGFDLTYNPEKTEFLKEFEKRGAMISNGNTMLIQQAEAAWKIWNENKKTS